MILALAAGGCGGASGVSSGATVSVYVSAQLHGPEARQGRVECAGARSALANAGGEAGDVRVRVVCLDASGPAAPWSLARVGANARRAVEDSTTVAYIGEPDREARLQSRPIVEEAGIAEVVGSSGSSAMESVLQAIRESDSSSLRESVAEVLGVQ